MACGPELDPGDFLRTVHFRREVLAPYYEHPTSSPSMSQA